MRKNKKEKLDNLPWQIKANVGELSVERWWIRIWNTTQQENLLITFENRDISNINPNHKTGNKIIITKGENIYII